MGEVRKDHALAFCLPTCLLVSCRVKNKQAKCTPEICILDHTFRKVSIDFSGTGAGLMALFFPPAHAYTGEHRVLAY